MITNSKTSTSLKSDEINRIKCVFREHQSVEEVYSYVSRAVRNSRSASDIDMAITGKQVVDRQKQLFFWAG